MDARAVVLLNHIRDALVRILGDQLVGMYVHGSLAFGCFCWEKSDIDFLIVTNQAPTLAQKEAIIEELCLTKTNYPANQIEFSLVLLKDCLNFSYPTPYYLHYSIGHQENCLQNITAYCKRMQGVDRDLAAHFTVTRAVGIVWYGQPIAAIFAPVPKADYLNSILYDIENAEEEIGQNPVYFVLNLCRVWAYVQTEQVLSKRQGGAWALCRLPHFASLIQEALRCYAGEQDHMLAAQEALSQFAREMLARIRAENDVSNLVR